MALFVHARKRIVMNTAINEQDIVHHDKKLGIITQNQLILYIGNREEQIDIQSVNNVQLIKKRVFRLNLFLLVGSLVVFYFTYFFYHMHSVVALLFFAVGLFAFLFSFYHKNYNYTIVIKEKNKTTHQLRAKQVYRENVKKFYFKIAKRISKKNVNPEETSPLHSNS